MRFRGEFLNSQPDSVAERRHRAQGAQRRRARS